MKLRITVTDRRDEWAERNAPLSCAPRDPAALACAPGEPAATACQTGDTPRHGRSATGCTIENCGLDTPGYRAATGCTVDTPGYDGQQSPLA